MLQKIKGLLQDLDSPEVPEVHESGMKQAAPENEDLIRDHNSAKLPSSKGSRTRSAPFLIDPRLAKVSVRHAFFFELQNQVPKFRKLFDKIAKEYCSLFASLNDVQQTHVTYHLTKGSPYDYRFLGCLLDLDMKNYNPWSYEEPTEGQLKAIERFNKIQIPFETLISEFNIEKPWVRQVLMDALDSRRLFPKLPIPPMIFDANPFKAQDFTFTFPGIENHENLKSYSARAEVRFNEKLKEYVAKTEKDAIANRLRRPGGRPGDIGYVKHYVAWAILGHSPGDIFIAAGADDAKSDGGKGEFKPGSIRRRMTRIRDDWDLPYTRDKTSRKRA